MTIRKAVGWLWLALCLVACESPLVGLECKAGFTLCAGSCVDLTADFRHCGSCNHSCGQYVCQQGSCSSQQTRDSGVPHSDAGNSDGGGADAGRDDDAGGVGNDAGLSGCAVGHQDCAGECSNPENDPRHCGSCDVSCASGLLCSAGTCSPECEKTLTQCGDLCIDLQRDPDHCGNCSMRCASGICELGACADAIAGQVVVIGHDFLKANKAMQRVAGNAVFLGLGAPVRVLVYTGDADPASVDGVERAVDVVKAETGRDWQRVQALEALVPLQLSAADVLLIHAQAGASNSTLQKLGTQWGNALSQFVSIGGVIVVIDAPSDHNSGTFQVLEPAHIFQAAGRTKIADQPLTVTTPGLGVAVRVPDRYMSLSDTVHFNGAMSPGSFAVVDRDGLPVVVQRVVTAR